MKFTDVNSAEEVSAVDCARLWPKEVFKFYEDRLEWHQPTTNTGISSTHTTENAENTDGEPQDILCMQNIYLHLI